MPCEPITHKGKIVGYSCTRSREKPKLPPCYKCGKPATKLCDFRDYGLTEWKDSLGRKRVDEYAGLDTCDKPMCDDCAHHIGEDTDFCDFHYNELAMYRTAKGEKHYKEMLKQLGITD